ncbi:cytochrome P450 [Bacillus sp. 7884-1]|uniref:cytochrome P450 n=1 Tax=Bacillus sp. 7884-1 TaxID=2021693 RepID=UPI00211C5A3D|nr:cytochrome P450 [Bacillus sp. 7884-1]
MNEISEIVGDRSVQFTDLTSLKYTQSTILETLRIYPPAWIIAREAAEDTDLMGYKINKGEHIFISQYVTHRDEKYYKDAHVFKPNRFENGRPIDVHEYAYFPFGGGSRICIGNHFALMEATMILVTILQKYKVLLPSESKEVELAPLITLRPKNGIKLRIQRRL